jgi:hypothetical protein
VVVVVVLHRLFLEVQVLAVLVVVVLVDKLHFQVQELPTQAAVEAAVAVSLVQDTQEPMEVLV